MMSKYLSITLATTNCMRELSCCSLCECTSSNRFFAVFILSIVFQLAHTVTATEFPLAIQPENKMPDEFAVHQIQTTANFATKSKLVSWLVGGLNFQIEHHLFPKISHVHYPAISKIVKQTCADFKLKYNEYPTVISAIKAHVQYLKLMSKPALN